MKRTIALLSVLAVSSVLSARADILAQWTFETSLPAGQPGAGVALTDIAAEVGTGVASGFHVGDSVYSNPVGNGSAESFSSTLWAVGDFYQFQFSTIGFTGIGISFDATSSNTGPRDFGVYYSVNGDPFTAIGGAEYSVLANAAPNTAWTGGTYNPAYNFVFDLSTITALDNATSVEIRLVNLSTVSANGGTVAATGTSRVDNFTAFSPVPEPSTAVLAILGGLLGFAFLRRQRQS
ncbi:MAG: PEP-CTERM sorting domain-containing protein [Verrucomicrobiae bacterium]|nr:PEP-CTERM sorting domain-containing protein [Verrucomicrobiae bacterium]